MKYALGIFVLLPFLLFLPWILLVAGGDRGAIYAFIHMPTLLCFICAIPIMLFATGEFKTFIKASNAVFSKKYVISYEDREKGIKLFEFLIKIVNYTAVICTIIALVLILGNLDDLHLLGPMLSIALLTALYAATFNFALLYPAIYVLKNRQNEEHKIVINEKEVINKLLELCYKQGISPEEILTANEISFRKQ